MSEQPQDDAAQENAEPEQVLAGSTQDGRVYVVGPEQMGVAGGRDEEQNGSVTDQVEEPAKVMRIATMIQRLLDEERAAPLDEPSRRRLAELHAGSVAELKDGLSPDLAAELERLARPFTPEHTPSDDELRIAQAQLVGWLEGLFQGIQTALVAQQMAARAQLERGRRELPNQQSPLGQHPAPGQAPGQGGMYL